MTKPCNQNLLLVLAARGMYFAVLVAAANYVFGQGKTPDDITIDRKPLAEFAATVAEQHQRKELDLSAAFSVEFEVRLTPKGIFDAHRSRLIKSDGDVKMIRVVARAIEIIGESGYFQYLANLDIRNPTVKVSQAEKNFSVRITSTVKSNDRARVMSSALNAMLMMAKMHDLDPGEKLLIESTKVTPNGTVVSIETAIQSVQLQEMLLKPLRSAND